MTFHSVIMNTVILCAVILAIAVILRHSRDYRPTMHKIGMVADRLCLCVKFRSIVPLRSGPCCTARIGVPAGSSTV